MREFAGLALALGLIQILLEKENYPRALSVYFKNLCRDFMESFLGMASAAALVWLLRGWDAQTTAVLYFLGWAIFSGLGYLTQRREMLYIFWFACGFVFEQKSGGLVGSLTLAALIGAAAIALRLFWDGLKFRLKTASLPGLVETTPAFLACVWLTLLMLSGFFYFFLQGS